MWPTLEMNIWSGLGLSLQSSSENQVVCMLAPVATVNPNFLSSSGSWCQPHLTGSVGLLSWQCPSLTGQRKCLGDPVLFFSFARSFGVYTPKRSD